MAKYQEDIQAFQALLGTERVILEDLNRYQTSSLGHPVDVKAELRVETEHEVMKCLETANHFKVPLYPISTGNNWGYGGATPVTDACIILNLQGLNKILDFNPVLGLVTVQPGVTQQQLRVYLDQRGSDYMVPTTGAGPNCSLLANVLERGFGPAQCNDHFLATTSFKAILANGEQYQSNFSELNADVSDKAFRWDVGPYLDGLFTQSNLGIVTQATIALIPQSQNITLIHCGTDDVDGLAELTASIRQIFFEYGQNIGLINLMNSRRILSMIIEFPFDLHSKSAFLDRDYIAEQAKRHKIHRWNIMGVIQGTKPVVNACKKGLKKILKRKADTLTFISDGQLNFMEKLSWFMPKQYGEMINNLRKVTELAQGRPNELALPLAYWLNRHNSRPEKDLNPDRDHCGLIWYSPVIPMEEERVTSYVEMIYRLSEEHNFEPLLTLSAISPRYFESTFPILYDKLEPGSVERAHEFYECLVEQGRKIGVFPYRLPVSHMKLLTNRDSSHMRFIKNIKKLIDPNNIIAPGRYCQHFTHEEESE